MGALLARGGIGETAAGGGTRTAVGGKARVDGRGSPPCGRRGPSRPATDDCARLSNRLRLPPTRLAAGAVNDWAQGQGGLPSNASTQVAWRAVPSVEKIQSRATKLA